MPRFALLEHDRPHRHWDFFLEVGPVLKAWRLLSEPAPGIDIPAEPIGDHRSIYLDYEGPLSGDRGSVRRWDGGTFEWVTAEPPVVQLWGVRFQGRVSLSRSAAGWRWRLDRDEPPVRPGDHLGGGKVE